MLRISLYLLAFLAVIFGLVLGTLNAQFVDIDLFWLQLSLPLGASLLLASACGVLFAVLTMLVFRVWPLRAEIRRLRRMADKQHSSGAESRSPPELPGRNA